MSESVGSVDPTIEVQKLRQSIKDLRKDHVELSNEVVELREENQELRNRVDELEDETSLLRWVKNADQPDGEEAQFALIQHLYRKATQRSRQFDKPPVASVNREGAAEALHYPDIDRSTYYKWMNRAADRVDGDVLYYGSGKLKLNLTVGDIPEKLKPEGEQ